ncbi:MAG TPA: YhjD/YihY/BrkB family envelope integrity protein, partial [Kofleriaceae bacterium]|nr:YhjD/YihY/BrkB family envelope integrity protein [Kofleriaceae bacterium]
LAFFIFNSLDNVVGAIWRVERKRPLAHKFMVFYATATIGTFLMATSLYQAAKFELTSGWTGPIIGLASTFTAAFLVNFVLPTAPVRVGPAAAGAAFFSLVFEIAKLGFGAYIGNVAFDTYAGIYGALAIAPILLVWVYYSWLMLLLGTELAYAIQNLHHLERLDRRGALSLENELSRRVNGVVAARVLTAIARAYASGEKTLSRRALSDRFDLSEAAVDRITARLKDANLVIEVDGDTSGFLPAKPPSDITLSEVLAAFRGDDVVIRRGTSTGTRLDQVLAEIESETESRARALHLTDLY